MLMLVKAHYEGNPREWCTGVNKVPQLKVNMLNPNYYDRNKSYYKKARVITWEDNWIALISYNTIVCLLSPENELFKTWDSYSKTTIAHINTFCDDFGLPKFNKAEWCGLPEMSHDDFLNFELSHDMMYERIKFNTM